MTLRQRRAEARAQMRAAQSGSRRSANGTANGAEAEYERETIVAQELETTLQPIIDIFCAALGEALEDEDALRARVQEVKGALFAREYAAAFGSVENLEAYVARWSPARALAYHDVFTKANGDKENCVLEAVTKARGDARVLCVGGGAGAEVVAFAGVLRKIYQSLGLSVGPFDDDEDEDGEEEGEEEEEEGKEDGDKEDKDTDKNTEKIAGTGPKLVVTAIDIADWSQIVTRLDSTINNLWFPQPDNQPPRFSVKFLRADVLALFSTASAPVCKLLAAQQVVTTMFTINELFKASRARAMQFLATLKAGCTTPGALLVFVESAGSYSDIQVGSKTFPVQFLIHHTLTAPEEGGKVAWERVVHSDSQWYRVPETSFATLEYPLKLENMRYFISVYRRL
ncbi:uncharacterized protein SAPINGB_P000229 [Magnusiomyces paraingens]|uniref:Uncharacterized protein n=1 Tax=Magnusiomyces paraingens TaxID=2606893 RepID=A0A5E8AZ24_9ASCO|nr:uncharacterized protein SAPINGB_P000229 [Saprochaete ingens]VVT43954.1 unnamed protein product [Saprochaete ingens]